MHEIFVFALFRGFSMFHRLLISCIRGIVYWQCDGCIIWTEYYRAGSRGYKTFFKLSSAEHEISTAPKCLNSQKLWKIQAQNSKTGDLSCS